MKNKFSITNQKFNKMNESNNNHETDNGTKPVLAEGLRYWVKIQFKGQYGPIRTWDITEEVKTLKEAQSYFDKSVNQIEKLSK
jgi:hypothetical protein